jgi:hypothetical protein
MPIPLAIPIIAAAISAVGTGIQAGQNAKANKLSEEYFSNTRERLLTDMHANPLDSVANKALLSQMDRRLNKQEEKVQNAATAGGATFENVLAAKQASNDAMADVVSGIMQGEQARQDSFRNQLLNIESQRVQNQVATKQASGQAWSNLASGIAGGLSLYGASLLKA